MTDQTQIPPNGRLAGRRAVITGGTSGLGLEMARRFLAEGAEVIVTGSNPARTAEVAASLGPRATGIVADVRERTQLTALAAAVSARWGTLDILVANAGLGNFAPIEALGEDAYDRQFDINVKGVFFTVQALSPLMGEGGAIILTGSAVHEKGLAGGSVYFATKAAIRSFARSLAAEFGPRGIRVNALSPGLVPTGFQARTGLPEEELDGFGRWVTATAPLGRLGRPEEIAGAAVFLASPEASYVTGADLVADGGFMAV